jgi:hypothetical protein
MEVCNGTSQGANTATSAGTSVSNSGTAGTYGSYVQLIASTATDSVWMTVTLAGGNFATSNTVVAKIAIGAAGSETDIILGLILWDGGTQATSYVYEFPVAIPAGTRLSVATAGSQSGAADPMTVSVILFNGSFIQVEGYSGIDAVGQSAAKGTIMTAGAINTKGAYAQLSASTSRDYMGFSLGFSASVGSVPNASSLIDIAIGAAGSEQVIVPNYQFWCGSGTLPSPTITSPVYPVLIPSGSRVAARFQNTSGSGSIEVTLYGIYQ